MLRTPRDLSPRPAPPALPIVVALLVPLAFAAGQDAPPAAAPVAPARESVERHAYDFSAESQLADFDPLTGSWLVSSGTLCCASKGAHEELRWRRKLTSRGSLRVTLASAAPVSLEFGEGERVAALRIDRSAARWSVDAAGHVVLERRFEPPATGPLALALRWSIGALDVRVGDDEEVHVALPADWSEPFATLSLAALRAQPRFDDLVIERVGPAGETAAPTDGFAVPTEDQRIAIEHATKRLDAGDAAGALALVADQVPPARETPPPPLPAVLAKLLQRIGQRDEKLREKEPLRSRYATRVVRAQDGSASLVLPLAADFVVEPVEIHRTDGRVLALRCREPAFTIEVARYDGKLEYWFGRDPRLVYCTGGGGPTLARARADEQKLFAQKSEWKDDVAHAKQLLDGETTYAYTLLRPDPARDGGRSELRESFALHRGDTWRFTVEGDPLALELAAEDVAFLLATFRFGKTGGG